MEPRVIANFTNDIGNANAAATRLIDPVTAGNQGVYPPARARAITALWQRFKTEP